MSAFFLGKETATHLLKLDNDFQAKKKQAKLEIPKLDQSFFRAMVSRQLLFGQIFVGKSVVLGNLGVGFQAFLNLTTSEKFLLLGLVVFQLCESFRCVGFVVPNHRVIFWVTSLVWCPEKKVAEKCLQGAKLVFFPLRPLSYWKEETSTAPFGRSTPTAGLGETGFRSLLEAWPWWALDTSFTG